MYSGRGCEEEMGGRGMDSYTTNVITRASLQLVSSEFFLCLFGFDALAHFISPN
jgi:hypothetical protein